MCATIDNIEILNQVTRSEISELILSVSYAAGTQLTLAVAVPKTKVVSACLAGSPTQIAKSELVHRYPLGVLLLLGHWCWRS